MNKICHITTVHPRYDIRIFYKECSSLAKKYDVSLIVADGLKNENNNNVNIIDIGLRQKSRLKRMFIDSKKAFNKAKALNCDVYHFHDPELIFIGLKLKKLGKKVIYDVHEDIPKQVGNRKAIPFFLRPLVSFIIEKIENKLSSRLNAITTSTPYIKNRLNKFNDNVITVKNYPIISEFQKNEWQNKRNNICYVGAITKDRGIFELLESFNYQDNRLILAGTFDNSNIENECKNHINWNKINYKGFVNRKEISEILHESKAGIVTLLPIVNYLDSLPIKMFEYMAAGIPVIASNFPLWKEIIEKNNYGICVDPTNPKEIANAINKLLKDDELAEEMGENGRKIIEEKYNWENEGKKLINLYSKLFTKN
ncbi:MAG: glycosyl transferase [Bacteroidetes bacterium 4572_117]|nr:MAG: glycosyl transferase [Bacteroidetes bacterium 4572_117]